MYQSDEPSLREGLQFLKEGLLFALIVALASGVASYFFSKRLSPTYQTNATLLASQPDPDLNQFDIGLASAPAIDFTAYRVLAVSGPVLAEARQLLDDKEALDSVSVNVRTEDMRISSFIRINTSGRNPQRVAEVANAVAQALINWDKNRASENLADISTTLQQQIAALSEQVRTLQVAGAATEARSMQLAERQDQLSYVNALSLSATGLLESVELAPVPLSPVAPRPLRNALLAFGLGLFASYGLLLLKYSLDTRAKNSEDLTNLTGLAVLAEFPSKGRPSQAFWDATGYLRANLSFLTKEPAHKVILLTSPLDTDQKSLVALSLAQSLVRSGKRTLLVDADMRHPAVASLLKLDPKYAVPLSLCLENPEGQFMPARVSVATGKELHVIPSFQTPPLPTELLELGIASVLAKWREMYDVIVVDGAPLLTVPDTLTVLPYVDGVVPVINLQSSGRRDILKTVDTLKRLDVNLLGMIAVNSSEVKERRQQHSRSRLSPVSKSPVQTLPPADRRST